MSSRIWSLVVVLCVSGCTTQPQVVECYEVSRQQQSWWEFHFEVCTNDTGQVWVKTYPADGSAGQDQKIATYSDICSGVSTSYWESATLDPYGDPALQVDVVQTSNVYVIVLDDDLNNFSTTYTVTLADECPALEQ